MKLLRFNSAPINIPAENIARVVSGHYTISVYTKDGFAYVGHTLESN